MLFRSYDKTKHLELPYKISFTGGEVTANRNFLPLVQFIREHYTIQQIVVTTNGSASTNYYLRLAELVEAISFSTHSEFWDEDKFFKNGFDYWKNLMDNIIDLYKSVISLFILHLCRTSI